VIMKILWWSNCPFTHTGYGRQTKETIVHLQKLGHEIAIASLFGLLGGTLDWNGVTIYPARQHPLGVDVIGGYAQHFGADVVISLYDVWAFPPNVRRAFDPPWIAMTPIDGAPVSPFIKAQVEQAEYPVAFSRFAERELQKAGIQCDYIPHGIDCDIFAPGDKEFARATLGLPQDVYMVTMVAANKGLPPRKSWPEALAGFAKFHQRHPETILYLHTTKEPFAPRREGVYLEDLAIALEIPRQAIIFADQESLAIGVPDEELAMIYQASDVFLNTAMGEGFGLPVLEAQACGTPVITQDCSAMSEITSNGIAVEPLQPVWIPQLNYWWQMASVEKVNDALEFIYLNWGDKDHAKRGIERGRALALEYNWPVVASQYWKPFLERVEAELW
jgi:glycosyltransferase involved in cell wall biosynthesis